MAYAFDTKFDVSNLDELNRRLARCPKEAQNAVRKSNRGFAAQLRGYERAAMPSGGSKYGARHDTPAGAMKMSIVSRATAEVAYVRGGGGKAPHFIVQEFGGGVLWRSKRGRKHGIRIKARNAEGYFFFPTGKKHVPELQQDATDAAMQVMQEQLATI